MVVHRRHPGRRRRLLEPGVIRDTDGHRDHPRSHRDSDSDSDAESDADADADAESDAESDADAHRPVREGGQVLSA
jgi:hypothetical protein